MMAKYKTKVRTPKRTKPADTKDSHSKPKKKQKLEGATHTLKTAMAVKSKSAFKRVAVQLEASLPPLALKDVERGVREYLNEQIMQYDDDLQGVVLGYTGLRAQQSMGRIIDDSPFIIIPVSVTFLLFAPQIGSTLVGEVHKVGADHVGLLVHKTFNAAIAKSDMGEGFEFDADSEVWIDGDKAVEVGTMVAFEVTGMELLSEVISIAGRLVAVTKAASPEKSEIEEEVVEEEETKQSKTKKSKAPQPDATAEKSAKKRQTTESVSVDQDEEPVTAKKKKKKAQVEEEEGDGTTKKSKKSAEAENVAPSAKKSAKKKKE
eukprot:comp16610_c0_seq1/m.14766 comp16610_c0_seq1/g.14766  ORF comp16610_c0_seq1/g.14766 comp16610_c0_seq1/m.14766 type:complete len:319 (-) comp16610_c0_seq1:88-1044(-)